MSYKQSLNVYYSFEHYLASQLTCIRLLPCDDDPNYDCKAVDVRLLSGDCVYTLQVLRGHVAQCPSPSRPC